MFLTQVSPTQSLKNTSMVYIAYHEKVQKYFYGEQETCTWIVIQKFKQDCHEK